MIVFRAIQALRPNASFSITDDDVSTVVWQSEETMPTQAEIDAKVIEIELADQQEKLDIETAKASATAKLAVLGLTPEEIAALFK